MTRTELRELQQENSMTMMIEEGGHGEWNERLPNDGAVVYRRQRTVENEQVESVCGKKKSKNALKEEQMKFHKAEKENSLLREQLNQARNERKELSEINSSLSKQVKSQGEQLMKSTQEVAGLMEKLLELKQTMEAGNKKLLLMQKKLGGMEDMMKTIDKKGKMKEKNLVQRIVARVCSRKRS